MSYFAQGIQQGAEIGARSYLEKKRRDQEASLNRARLDFEANQLKEQFKGQGGLQELRQKFEAEQGGLTRTFQSGEREKDRTYGTSEREKTQEFTTGRDATANSNENFRRSEDRNAATRMAFEKNLAASDTEMRRDMAARAKELESRRRFEAEFAAKYSPDSIQNKWTDVRTQQIEKADGIGRFAPPAKTPGPAPMAGTATGAGKYRVGQKIVQDGVTYVWDGKQFSPAP